MRQTLTAICLATGAAGVALATLPASAQQAGSRTSVRAPIEAAAKATTRTPANVARDRYRNPVETLSFFGLRPGQTVVELWPGGGWYTEILAPFHNRHGGTLYAAGPWDRGLNGVKKLQEGNRGVYGKVRLAAFPAADGQPAIPAGSADLVLTFRNVHNWRFGGADRAQAAFNEIAGMLKPGGQLGVVEHRLPEAMDATLEEKSGYLKESTVIALAEKAGLKLVGRSEINANPRDTHVHPEGVWTLPPSLRLGDTDRAKYVAIGESDRMTLVFRKPPA